MNREIAFRIGLGLVFVCSPILFSQEARPPETPPAKLDKGIFDQFLLALKTPDKEAPEPEADDEGVEPLGKGRVHDAFATPAVFSAQANPIVPKEPPAPVDEMPPDQKPEGSNVQWIRGYFAFDDDKQSYYWVSGLWRNIPPNMEWVPGAWTSAKDGFQFVSGFWRPASATGELEVVPTPPEPLQTADVPAPNAESVYVPGTWIYRESRYVWRAPCWIPQRIGWVWVPAHYVWTRCGCVFVDGYWDYDLRDRGLLFAPVCFDYTICCRPGYCYRPRYILHDHCLLGCLFVNRTCGGYYFGDYYDIAWGRSGFVIWTNFRVCRNYDPLFAYYRYSNRNNPLWEANLLALQTARFKGQAPLPPISLGLQKKSLAANSGHVANLALLAPISLVNKNVLSLKTLDKTQMNLQIANIAKQKDASGIRAINEVKLSTTLGAVKLGDQPKTFKLDLPKTTQETVLTQRILTIPVAPQGNKTQILIRDNTIVNTLPPSTTFIVNPSKTIAPAVIVNPPKTTIVQPSPVFTPSIPPTKTTPPTKERPKDKGSRTSVAGRLEVSTPVEVASVERPSRRSIIGRRDDS